MLTITSDPRGWRVKSKPRCLNVIARGTDELCLVLRHWNGQHTTRRSKCPVCAQIEQELKGA